MFQDDPLSALDAHVCKHVFDEVIFKKLLRRKKTVILVTHQLQFLNFANSVSSSIHRVKEFLCMFQPVIFTGT